VSSPYEFLQWILLLSRPGKERKGIADFRLQNVEAWSMGKDSWQQFSALIELRVIWLRRH
jgi:hypothetical protein